MTDTTGPAAGLRLLGGVMDAYLKVFVSGPAAPLLSRPNPVRRSGFDIDVGIGTRTREADDVVSLTLRRAGGGSLPEWRPGAHVDVFLPSGLRRQYSLCGDPADRDRYRIAVRRIPGGSASAELHDALRVGDRLRIRGPRNAFTLVDAPSYLFVAGGIGITPILPMARAAGARGRLVYAGRSRSTMPFLDEIPSARILPDDECGTPDMAALLDTAEPGAAVYVCGPPPMLAAAQRCMFESNPTGSLHTERFSARPVVDGREFGITLARTGTTLRVGAEETALAAVRRALPNVAYSCQQGFCGFCEVGVLAGAVDHRDRLLTESARAQRILLCVSRAAGDQLVLDL
ncbi:2Fe-2S iron-sulfur cluster binding domain-containing protein [Nocardia sp. SYP-A9097]|uniref:PDR/VanB family oxidoreductase n=1 Tax=Nocardia sp. SYP-A9097 TaxID=2663237 RepID=UPI00129B0DD1|nr:PDR/VanB family oxidoreductase [Nocardia sp. SYP-A9097]MRH89886.1 2Fe-2S iron-sulfur cluster binding domain-containing protein [Nocardia sp. SYP-A9097]